MRTTTINAYPYKQYDDDPEIWALFDSYNQATQFFIDWFNSISLPYYPGLTGGLLDWVVAGLYGLKRTQLASPVTPALGMYNTLVPYGSLQPYNTFVPSSQTFYNLTDDVFQRILTWNFFKGDGRRFSIRWLKRRIMRFLAGVNGVDPSPFVPGFVPGVSVGTENTSAIGVVISSGTVTVSIDQSLLSLQIELAPNILQLFQLAFQGGNLELPLQYDYVCNIIVNFVALARPGILVTSGNALNQTTPSTYVTVLGGTGLYTYSWAWASGGTGITIDAPSAASTTFTATGLTWGQTVSGIAQCTVHDTVSGFNATADVEVTIDCLLPSQIATEGGIPLAIEGLTKILIIEP